MARKSGTTGVSSYDTRNHCSILFQCYGSVFPRVISFCITNVVIMILAKLITDAYEWDALQVSNIGHSFISLIVSFLLVSRVNTSLGRYNEARSYLGQMYRETRTFLFWLEYVFLVTCIACFADLSKVCLHYTHLFAKTPPVTHQNHQNIDYTADIFR